MSLFNTIVIKKITTISKSGLDLFIINNNFDTTKCHISPFFSLSCLASFLTSNNLLVSEHVTNALTSSANISMHYYRCLTIYTCMVLYFISIFIFKKLCMLPLTTDISPTCFFTYFMISNISPLYFYTITCCNPHTKQWYIVRPISIFFNIPTINIYLKSKSSRVAEKRLYHSNAYPIQP